AASPETNTAGTPKLPATAATIPDSPTSVPLMVALYQVSEETVWQSTPSGIPAMAWAPTNTTQSHSPRSIGPTYRAHAYPTMYSAPGSSLSGIQLMKGFAPGYPPPCPSIAMISV